MPSNIGSLPVNQKPTHGEKAEISDFEPATGALGAEFAAPALRLRSGRSSLEMVHWTISFASRRTACRSPKLAAYDAQSDPLDRFVRQCRSRLTLRNPPLAPAAARRGAGPRWSGRAAILPR